MRRAAEHIFYPTITCFWCVFFFCYCFWTAFFRFVFKQIHQQRIRKFFYNNNNNNKCRYIDCFCFYLKIFSPAHCVWYLSAWIKLNWTERNMGMNDGPHTFFYNWPLASIAHFEDESWMKTMIGYSIFRSKIHAILCRWLLIRWNFWIDFFFVWNYD